MTIQANYNCNELLAVQKCHSASSEQAVSTMQGVGTRLVMPPQTV